MGMKWDGERSSCRNKFSIWDSIKRFFCIEMLNVWRDWSFENANDLSEMEDLKRKVLIILFSSSLQKSFFVFGTGHFLGSTRLVLLDQCLIFKQLVGWIAIIYVFFHFKTNWKILKKWSFQLSHNLDRKSVV